VALVFLPGAARLEDLRRGRVPGRQARDARAPRARLEVPSARAERARARDRAARGPTRGRRARAGLRGERAEAARLGIPLDEARLRRLGLERHGLVGGVVGVAPEVAHLELVAARQHLDAAREVPGGVARADPLALGPTQLLDARRVVAAAEHCDLR